MLGDFCLETRPKIIFGEGSINNLKEEVSSYNNILIVYGVRSVIENGSLELVKSNLVGKNIFDLKGIVPNPKLSKIYEGIEICKQENIDLVIALGGGSVIDSAKAIALGAKSEDDIWDIITKKKPVASAVDLAVIPTMIATGSETNDIFVVLNDKENLKRSLKDKNTYPKFTIMDPTYTITIDRRNTVAGIVDTLSHILEQYVNDKGSVIINSLLVTYFKRMQEVGKNLVKNLDSYDSREEHMYIAMQAYNGDYRTIVGGDFACHGLDYGLAGEFNNIHGEGLSIVTCNWLLYVVVNKLKNHEIISEFFKELYGEEDTILAISQLKEYLKEIGAPTKYKDIGIEFDDATLDRMVENSQFVKPLGNTIPLNEAQIKDIYLMGIKN